MECKTLRAIENVDWESCQNKYSDILKLFLDQYPTPENAVAIEKDFRHNREQIVLPPYWFIVRQETGHGFYVIGFENIRIHPSTRYRTRCGFIFFHSGEQI